MNVGKFTNAASTVAAVLMVLSGVMTQVLGCKMEGDAVATCSASFLPPKYAVMAALFFAATTLVLKLLRPGGALASLFGPTAVVVPEDKSKPGVVTPAQVASK